VNIKFFNSTYTYNIPTTNLPQYPVLIIIDYYVNSPNISVYYQLNGTSFYNWSFIDTYEQDNYIREIAILEFMNQGTDVGLQIGFNNTLLLSNVNVTSGIIYSTELVYAKLFETRTISPSYNCYAFLRFDIPDNTYQSSDYLLQIETTATADNAKLLEFIAPSTFATGFIGTGFNSTAPTNIVPSQYLSGWIIAPSNGTYYVGVFNDASPSDNVTTFSATVRMKIAEHITASISENITYTTTFTITPHSWTYLEFAQVNDANLLIVKLTTYSTIAPYVALGKYPTSISSDYWTQQEVENVFDLAGNQLNKITVIKKMPQTSSVTIGVFNTDPRTANVALEAQVASEKIASTNVQTEVLYVVGHWVYYQFYAEQDFIKVVITKKKDCVVSAYYQIGSRPTSSDYALWMKAPYDLAYINPVWQAIVAPQSTIYIGIVNDAGSPGDPSAVFDIYITNYSSKAGGIGLAVVMIVIISIGIVSCGVYFVCRKFPKVKENKGYDPLVEQK